MPRPSRLATPMLGVLVVTAALLLAGCTADAPPSVASLDDPDAPGIAGLASTTEPALDLDGDPRGLSECMAEQGVPIPMPTQDGHSFTYRYPEGVPIEEVDEALAACARFMPGAGAPPEHDPEQLARLRELAECMREHGVDDYPDPRPDGVIDIPPGSPIDPTAPDYLAAQAACVHSDR
ncbi:hypothetical protein PX701_01285 [Agromyces sp. H3Y2-19a]|uniref:hypothetical protein n=1 Tax=Agromyces TaxID=33877 RepID=UPI001E472A1B|nr:MULTISPECIES: hypothetical protein [Agromyces]MCD5345878.1 hypothetical protein [Agromyces sp. S2-1-8]MDF0512243.1 hypothetical protein [Agromyces chromiiresistens]